MMGLFLGLSISTCLTVTGQFGQTQLVVVSPGPSVLPIDDLGEISAAAIVLPGPKPTSVSLQLRSWLPLTAQK